MRGLEARLEISKGVNESLRRVERIAEAVGVECLTGKTNLRTFTRLPYEDFFFGAGLSATALSLADGFNYVCIPSGFSYNHMVPHGSSHLVDEMYSTEKLTVVHDGAEANRAEKLAQIVEWNRRLVLDNLRVCHWNRGGDYNCGKCKKCVRTAISLYIVDSWYEAKTFPDKSRGHWEEFATMDHLVLVEENLALARARGADRELIAMLERVVRRKRGREMAKALVHDTPLARTLPLARKVRSGLRQLPLRRS